MSRLNAAKSRHWHSTRAVGKLALRPMVVMHYSQNQRYLDALKTADRTQMLRPK